MPFLGAVLLRSAAMGILYAGIPRWYTMAAMALAYLAAVNFLAPLFWHLRRLLTFPARAASRTAARLWRPVRCV